MLIFLVRQKSYGLWIFSRKKLFREFVPETYLYCLRFCKPLFVIIGILEEDLFWYSLDLVYNLYYYFFKSYMVYR